jgi:diguanylate cyclase (GGDEF)-like protein
VGELESANTTLEYRVGARTDELAEMAARFEALSLEDPLLGIGNRRAMETALDRIVDLAMRYERSFSALLLDVDHFKAFNDLYGHGQGDRALVDVATTLRTHQRKSDASYRYGGEEFLVLLPETENEGAYCVAERLRVAVEQIGRPHRESERGVVTVSCGVATFRSGDESWRVLVDRADAALYRAKENGRNRVEFG